MSKPAPPLPPPTVPVVLALQDRMGRFFSGEEVYTGYHKRGLPYPLLSPDVFADIRRHTLNLLDPFRLLVGPLQVNSWYRTRELNKLVHGNEHSYHMLGLATDVVPYEMDLRLAFEKLRLSGLDYEQIIIYPSRGFIHVASPKVGDLPSREALTCDNAGKYHAA